MSLVLLHGFLGAPSTWDGVLAELGRDALCPVLPGHGPAPDTRATSFDAAADALAADIPPASVIAGYSMGGRLALAIALRHPEVVKACVVIGADPGLEDRAWRRAWDSARARELEERGVEAFVAEWEALPLFSTQRVLAAELRAAERARRLSHTAAGAAWAMRTLGLGSQPSLWNALAGSRIPLAFLAGAQDTKFAELATRASRIAPHGSLTLVPGAGHNLALEAPAAVAAVLSRALSIPVHQETRP